MQFFRGCLVDQRIDGELIVLINGKRISGLKLHKPTTSQCYQGNPTILAEFLVIFPMTLLIIVMPKR